MKQEIALWIPLLHTYNGIWTSILIDISVSPHILKQERGLQKIVVLAFVAPYMDFTGITGRVKLNSRYH